MLKSTSLYISFLFAGCFFANFLFAQPTWTIDPLGKEKKPEQYEEKKLASEKTGEKKFTKFRRFIQNNTTRYNYYFNADNKLDAVVERAKSSNKDDYSKLLSFYPYSLENTAAQQTELDSVIYKATSGLLLHDLRSDWVDNMYLLIGKAYYYRDELDSAALTFQFINYNLFPRKKKEDDDRVVGTNDAPGTGGISIANKENPNLFQKAFSLPPSRNDALIWLARTFTSQGAFGDAAGLINILQNDRNLPTRLQNDLEEVTAYWFFKQNIYDSSATHLEKALSTAQSKQDLSRWEFLLAQMYEMNGKYDKASEYYAKASKHTVDPVLDIYAQLNDAKMLRDGDDPRQLDRSINNLLRMAKKDRYENYRDIIYYSAGQLALSKPDTANSVVYLDKSVLYKNVATPIYSNKSFFDLGNISYAQQRYRDAYAYYDSLQLSDEEDYVDKLELKNRKEALAKLVQSFEAIEREDSLQRIAAMAPGERDAFVKKMVRKMRKERGIKDEDDNLGSIPITFNNDRLPVTDLFDSNNSKGEWYFYNNNLRSKGLADFTRKWGKRPNVDNWRTNGASIANLNSGPGGDPGVPPDNLLLDAKTVGVAEPQAINYDAYMANLPTTTEKLDSSYAIIASNLLQLGIIFQNDLQEYGSAIEKYKEFLVRFPDHKDEAEAYLGLYYCYSKLGDNTQAAYFKNLLTKKHADSRSAILLQNPSLLNPNAKNPEVTARYEKIYGLYIEGKFDEANAAKLQADSIYGSNYWTPQLLYIEAVHLVKEREDSNAIAKLNDLQKLYPESPLSAKAATLADVVSRREEIENYLSNLEVSRNEEAQVVIAEPAKVQTKTTAEPLRTEPKKIEPAIVNITKKDSSFAVAPIAVNAGFQVQPEVSQAVMMILDKVDGVYINEAKNAFTRFNRESYITQNIVITRDTLDAARTIFLFSPFENMDAAMVYFDKIKKAAPREISWLPANKYSFLIISDNNLQLLKSNKDLEGYRQLLNKSIGNKF